MALQGTIDTFELTEVVRLLAAGGKTGVLRLEGTRGSGRLWVNEGKVTAIEVDHAPRTGGHAEAMFELLRFDDGSFTFASGDLADPEGEPTELEEILTDAGAQLSEWREIEKVVPTTRATVTLRPELSRGDVVLDKQRWRLVAAIGGGVTVATLGEAMDLGELPVSRAVKELIELGVVDLDDRQVDEVPPEVSPADEVPFAMTAVDEVVVVAPEPAPVFEPAAAYEPESAMEDVPMIVIEAEPVLPDPPADGSARTTLDEFAAGFGMSDLPTVESDDSFAGFGVEANGDGRSEEGEAVDLFDPLGDFSLSDDDAFGAPARPADPVDVYEDPPSPFLGAGNDAAEVARQLSNLSPAAARAVAAAAKATTDEEREAALEAVSQEGDEPIDRELLLRFLASVKS